MIDASYGSKTDNYFEDKRDEMLRFVPMAAATMLEVGCGNASFAANLKQQRKIHVTAIEGFAAAAEIARQRVDRLLADSLENALPTLAGEQFDCILLNDVLEHLVDPWAALTQLHALLSTQGVVVASIPNIRYLPVFKDFVFRGKWQYQRDGVLDRTHLRFFTRSSMQELFESTGYAMRSIDGINATHVSWKFDVLNKLTRGSLADTRFKQFACVAGRRPASA